jgi:glycosyltransferase involved in cell wall biosynthesis
VNLRAIKSLAQESDIVVCHLPHDHLLCAAASVHRRIPLVRAYRNPRHLRQDPYHAFLDRRLSGALLGYSALENDLPRTVSRVPAVSIPVPTEDLFRPVDGTEWRQRLSIPPDVPVIGSVGKLARERGFSLFLEAVSRLAVPAHVVVVGHGEHRPNLEERASALGLDGRIHWTGYQERALPELYSVMNIMLFTAPGSDWGHRAISEAQGCGCPVIAVALPGVEDLIEDGVTGRIVSARQADLANATEVLLRSPEIARQLGKAAAIAVEERRLAPLGHRIKGFLEEVLKNAW